MILDKKPLPDDPTPSEPPPSYEELQRVAASLTQHRDTKDLGRFSPTSPSASSSSISPCLPLTAKRSTSKGKSRWFPFGQAARTAQEVKHTVLALVRDVVRVPEPSAAISILKNCAEACVTHDLSFSAVLQEKSVEGHTPIYWAIVKRPAEPVRPTDPDLVTVLLSLAAPLSEATLSEIRLACLQTSDQVLFQRLRRVPAFSPLSGADEILLGASIPPDEIEVEDIPGDQGAFKVQFRILLFQKRMRVTKSINLEFIARGRLWSLSFLVSDGKMADFRYEKGAWLVRLTLLEHSPPTWVEAHLLVDDPRTTPREKKEKPKPTIELPIKTGSEQLAPPPRWNHTTAVVMELYTPLSKSLLGNSLQYDGCAYISPDGSLTGRLEALLAKTEGDCIIC